MYRNDVRDILRQNAEANREILFDFIGIYMKMLIFLPNLVEERKTLVKLVSQYLHHTNNEDEVLKSIRKKFGKIEENETIDELLDEFDMMFEARYDYYQKVFSDYESVIEDYTDLIGNITERIVAFKTQTIYAPGNNEKHRMYPGKTNFPLFDDGYKQKVLDTISSTRVS